MKIPSWTIYQALPRLIGRLRGDAKSYAAAEPPLRSELFSADQMEFNGKTLANSHRLSPRRGTDLLLARLFENEKILVGVHSTLTASIKANRRITPAGEWLLDNFYLIEEQIRTARRHFPKGYSRELPILETGSSASLPRVYDIALEAISHGDGKLDLLSLDRFVAAYLKVADLKLGELWAIPIMLRLALIENLRRVGARVVSGMINRRSANVWADQMLVTAEKDPKNLIVVIADMARSNPPLVDSFVAELARRLQGQSSVLPLALTWVEHSLSESGQTIEGLIQSETQSQAANQVSIGNSIGSLRLLGAMNWRDFVEKMSAVELKLRQDPHGVYGSMDFVTRDRYRHVIERIAKISPLSESDVADKAIKLAHQGNLGEAQGADTDSDVAATERMSHVGYFLIDKGLPLLELEAGARIPFGQLLARFGCRFAFPLYLGSAALLTVFFTGSLLQQAAKAGLAGWELALIGIPLLLGTSQLALALVNWIAALLATAQPLPRMDFSPGIPPQSRTLVVTPTMLINLETVDELAQALEVRFLANRDAKLHFGLLTDFRDALHEALPDDEPLLRRAREQIEALNQKYGRGDAFFLFHRPRLWNAGERIWMGYERKRGKLGDLNAFLRTELAQPFSLIVGDTSLLSEVKYVITLDTDTQLPRDSARQLVATMAHPLNRAEYNETRQRITAGYGILQPRMAVTLPSANRSLYARICGGEPGVDSYTRVVSDVYQDLFQEGSFIGKGIYDVDAFEQSLKGRFPENLILSHDLLEGCYARSGLTSDVQLYEDHPSHYRVDVARRHRWIRGDWQIAAWLFARVPVRGPFGHKDGFAGGDGPANPLSMLSQWKILDNLRRSLVPVGLMALLLFGWMVVPGSLYWTVCVLGIMFFPPLAASILGALRKPKGAMAGRHVVGELRSVIRRLAQAALDLACLPYEALTNFDAIARSITRMLFTHRLLLEWKLHGPLQRARGDGSVAGDNGEGSRAYQPSSGSIADLMRTWGDMWSAPATAMTIAITLMAVRPIALIAAAPILFLWFFAPTLVWWICRPISRRLVTLRSEQTIFLRKLARKTWRFFEDFVTTAEHDLPPDNYQEHPVAVVAHRTSPTNIGLTLLANLAANDFGYIPTGKFIERTASTFRTMRRLERYHGHFYNWYDTTTLTPLLPRYVSAVDSGNLSAHLLTLRAGLLALADQPIFGARTFEGLQDTLENLADAGVEAAVQLIAPLAHLRRAMDSSCAAERVEVKTAHNWLVQQLSAAAALKSFASQGDGLISSPVIAEVGEVDWWTHALIRQYQEALDELTFLLPWVRQGEVPECFRKTLLEIPAFNGFPTLRDVSLCEEALHEKLGDNPSSGTTADDHAWLAELRPLAALASMRARERLAAITELGREADEFAAAKYSLLYDSARDLLTVGYNVDQKRRDTGHYDLLASEARLASFVAIAQGEIPQQNWLALGRLLTSAGSGSVLISWSGSMFEYLMPMLVMPSYEYTLLDQSCLAAVNYQIAYGKQLGIPWGTSESGYNMVDASLNYQYRAFGVPELGLKRGLSEDLVTAPYASALALMVSPEAACENLQRLASEGLQGKYGLFEAIDFTPSRVPLGRESAVVRSFMAHHQGMSLLSLAYLLLDQPMQKRFMSDPRFQATSLLLQERIPAASAFHFHRGDLSDGPAPLSAPAVPMRLLRGADTPAPEVQLLSNGRYHVMVTNAGGGYSRWKDLAVTRWREDGTRDHWGAFCYIRDIASGNFWSTAYQPTLKRADSYEAILSEARVEFRRTDHGIETHTEIVVSPEDDIELRRSRITNRSRARRTIEVTSYAEVVLTSAAADAMHPAFSNLFVHSEIIPDRQAIICTRLPRSVDERMPCMFHLMAVHGTAAETLAGEVSYETDRMRFIGRTRSLESPLAMREIGPLAGSQGSVLDPIVAIRHCVTLNPGESVTVDVVSGIAETRTAALGLIGKYRDRNLADRVFDLAWAHSWVNLRQINVTEADAQLFGRLAGSVIFANPLLRADAGVLTTNRRGQSGLWGYAISGDLPIMLLQIGDIANIELVRQAVQAHTYWRLKGLAVDLVIWNEEHAGYRQLLQEQIMGLVAAGIEAHIRERPGGIFVRAAEQLSAEDRILFQAVARAIITDTRGTLADQINRLAARDTREALPPGLPLVRQSPIRAARNDEPIAAIASPQSDLLFFNGMGGFAADGREYVITIAIGRPTPAPWVNVIANAHFGTVISESGAAYTWSENAHEFRLTPWDDDPVIDAGGEAIYIRDEESGHFWSPTPLPCGGAAPYVVRHGFGYSTFEHNENGIRSELRVHVDTSEAVKFSVLKIVNTSGRTRKLSVTGYVEWVLGDLRPKSAMHVVTEVEPVSGALCARNAYSAEFSDRMAFFDANGATREANVTLSADRVEFLGRNGSLRNPAAMARSKLSNRIGAGLDPCAAIQVPFELADGQAREIVFRLGVAGRTDVHNIGEKLQHSRRADAASKSLEAVRVYWTATLGAVQVETPDASLNVLANGWLLYQVIACRLWARSGYYQSGGAFGFRDQLQDAMALLNAEPSLAREHLLRSAARQYIEGDVQHWWHPPAGRGVRTHCSDDFLWLPQAVCRYVAHTGDSGVLSEAVPFLEGRLVKPGDDSYYDLPTRSETHAELYEHCVRAIRRGLSFGVHGLPLMGSGDWNDGMNLVGIQGRGESVWLGFFLCDTLAQFAVLADRRGDTGFATHCREQAEELRRNLELHGWDGEWYRRAYFDDGTPLGSQDNDECKIDSIAQSWSVLSGAGDAARARAAMDSLDERLVRRDSRLVQLLDPPFDKSALNPGYIKGYVPGIRENGGQYTHAAIWAAMAFATLGDNRRAWELFDMINPVNHADSPAAIATYKVEPYVIAADVYAIAPHTGRGGWTWYTGSAGLMYRLILESLLGLRVEAGQLRFEPCVPDGWKNFSMRYRYGESLYIITVLLSSGAERETSVSVDGLAQRGATVALVDDGQEHRVEVTIRNAEVPSQ